MWRKQILFKVFVRPNIKVMPFSEQLESLEIFFLYQPYLMMLNPFNFTSLHLEIVNVSSTSGLYGSG